MARRKHDDLGCVIKKERIDCNGKGIGAHLPEYRECRIDLCNSSSFDDCDLAPDAGGGGPNVVQLSFNIRHIRIDENADGRCIGSQLTHQPEPLRLELGLKPARTSEIAARSMQAGAEPGGDGICGDCKAQGWGGGCGFRCTRSNVTADGNDNCNLPANEIGGQCSEALVFSLCPPVFDRHIAAFNKTGVIQRLSND